MPLPKPQQDENRSEFISRCVSDENVQNESSDRDQALAICSSIWDQEKSMEINESLLENIKSRQQKKSEFNYGILTADKYVRTLLDCVGSDLCYRYASAAKKGISFDDTLKKAAKTLTYSNPDMVMEANYGRNYKLFDSDGDELELPKNTLMAFRHVLTTPRKDRDGDVMRTQGASVDSKMLLLWQHVHTLPIGKLLAIDSHNSKKLTVVSAIVDMNELAHDAAVMIDNGMGRFSHGFRALEFEQMKEEEGELTGDSGFDVKRFEIMEESLVSVPSNVDAQVDEILVDMVEGGKLKSPIVKEMAKTSREKMPTRIPVELDLQVNLNGKPYGESDDKQSNGCSCGASSSAARQAPGSTPEEANGDDKGRDQAGTGAGEEGKGTSTDQKIITPGMIEGSWEWIEHKLMEKTKPFLVSQGINVPSESFVFLAATFADYAILCMDTMDQEPEYFRVAWEMRDNEPIFSGSPEKVEIEQSTQIIERMVQLRREKAGRTLSRANIKALTDIRDDLYEIRDKENNISRGSKAMLDKDAKTIEDLVKSKDDEEERHQSSQLTPEQAMGLFLSQASHDLRSRMSTAISQIDKAEEEEKKVAQYRELWR